MNREPVWIRRPAGTLTSSSDLQHLLRLLAREAEKSVRGVRVVRASPALDMLERLARLSHPPFCHGDWSTFTGSAGEGGLSTVELFTDHRYFFVEAGLPFGQERKV